MSVYHSALKEALDIKEYLDYYENNGNIVLQHDINTCLPSEYTLCDVFYSEPAWAHGYQKFLERANIDSLPYLQYLASLSRIVSQSSIPVWLVIGAHAEKKLPTPHRRESVMLLGYRTNLLGWNDDCDYSFSNNGEFVKQLAKQFNRVGDFNCGYGNSGKAFLERGKNFVMSDINRKCIYHIAKTLMGYESSVS